jgi:hypothetical protein
MPIAREASTGFYAVCTRFGHAQIAAKTSTELESLGARWGQRCCMRQTPNMCDKTWRVVQVRCAPCDRDAVLCIGAERSFRPLRMEEGRQPSEGATARHRHRVANAPSLGKRRYGSGGARWR